jgi:hypothetical protein
MLLAPSGAMTLPRRPAIAACDFIIVLIPSSQNCRPEATLHDRFHYVKFYTWRDEVRIEPAHIVNN